MGCRGHEGSGSKRSILSPELLTSVLLNLGFLEAGGCHTPVAVAFLVWGQALGKLNVT